MWDFEAMGRRSERPVRGGRGSGGGKNDYGVKRKEEKGFHP
jgi:hypothetical protein